MLFCCCNFILLVVKMITVIGKCSLYQSNVLSHTTFIVFKSQTYLRAKNHLLYHLWFPLHLQYFLSRILENEVVYFFPSVHLNSKHLKNNTWQHRLEHASFDFPQKLLSLSWEFQISLNFSWSSQVPPAFSLIVKIAWAFCKAWQLIYILI